MQARQDLAPHDAEKAALAVAQPKAPPQRQQDSRIVKVSGLKEVRYKDKPMNGHELKRSFQEEAPVDCCEVHGDIGYVTFRKPQDSADLVSKYNGGLLEDGQIFCCLVDSIPTRTPVARSASQPPGAAASSSTRGAETAEAILVEVDGQQWCICCKRWATSGHLDSAQHERRSANMQNWGWYQPPTKRRETEDD